MSKHASRAVTVPNHVKNFIYRCVDVIGGTAWGRRLLVKAVAVGNTGLGAGNHDFAGARTGENRVIEATCRVLTHVVALDIGANHGSWGLELLARCPSGSVVFVEPRARAARELNARLAGDRRARVMECALGSHEGRATLFGVDGAGDQASLRDDLLRRADIGTASGDLATEDVQVKTIPSLVADAVTSGVIQDSGEINVAKVDIEGLEFTIIGQLLESLGSHLDVIQFEFHVHALAQGNTVADFATLFGSEFNLYRLAPRVLIPLSELTTDAANYFGYSNWVAVRKAVSAEFRDAYRSAVPKMARPKEWIY